MTQTGNVGGIIKGLKEEQLNMFFLLQTDTCLHKTHSLNNNANCLCNNSCLLVKDKVLCPLT